MSLNYQYLNLDGTAAKNVQRVPDILRDLLGNMPGESMPGISGVDVNSGLVRVELSDDKRALMKFGKYLKKVGRPDAEVRTLSSKLKATLELMKGTSLEFTSSSEEAYQVYKDGPHSCMSGQECTRAYHSDNVAVAYVKIEDRVVARTVVCTDPDMGLRYQYIYGNKDIMEPLLASAGYESGNLEGCTLARIENGDGDVFMPYLDCGTYVSDMGDHIAIDSGEYYSQNTHGLLHGSRCECCGVLVGQDDEHYSEYHDTTTCWDCFIDGHVSIGYEWYAMDSDAVVQLHGGEWVLSDDACYVDSIDDYYSNDEVSWSEYSNEYFLCGDVVEAVTNINYPDGEACHKADCTLANDGKWVHNDIVEEYEDYQLNLELEE